ncbi:DMT family transporter [Curvibacter sp. CHRR-16]|nr:DMT family transporter [Curvibacter sp. CHRR-16]
MAALWGASWPWGRLVAQAMPALAAASLRFGLASLLLLVWLHHSKGLQSLRTLQRRQWLGLAFASSIGVLAYSIFFLLALQKVPAGKAAMVVALNPVVTLLLAVVLFREAANFTMCMGVVLAVIGALYALSGGTWLAMDHPHFGTGEWLLLGCSACWVGYTLVGRLVLTRIDSLTTTAMTAVFGTVFLLTASLLMEGSAAWERLATAPVGAWASLVALAVGATTLAYAWYLEGVKTLGAGAAAAYMALVPVFGLMFSSLWLGETVTPSLLEGGAVAILGMLLMNRGRMQLALKKA